VLLIYLINSLKHVQNIYCNTASTDLFDGEQNLCKVGFGHDTVYVNVKSSMKDKFKSYLFVSEPPVLDQVRHATYADYGVKLYGGDYTYYAFALPKGSSINFTVSATNSFAEWYFSTDYSSISDIRYSNIWERTGSGTYRFSYTAPTSETYYLTCYNSAYSDYNSLSSNWNVDVFYKQYDLTGPKQTCTGKTQCKFTGATYKYVVSAIEPGTLSGVEYTKNEITFGKDYASLTSLIVCCAVFMIVCIILAIISIVKLCLIAAVVSTAVSAVSSATSTPTQPPPQPQQTVVVVQQTPAPPPPAPAPYPTVAPSAPEAPAYPYGGPSYGTYPTEPSAPPPGYAVF